MRYSKVALLILLIVWSFFSFSQNKVNKYSKVDSLLNEDSEDKMFNGFSAVRILENDLVGFNNESEYWMKYAMACYFGERDTKALSSIEKAIEINPNNYDAYLIKAKFSYNINDDLNGAKQILDSIVKYDNTGEFYFYRGIYNFLLKDTNQALADYNSSIKRNYSDENLYLNKAIILLSKGMYAKSLSLIEKAILINSKNSVLYKVRGEINLFMLRPTEMCADVSKAKQLGYNAFRIKNLVSLCNFKGDELVFNMSTIIANSGEVKLAVDMLDSLILDKDTSVFYNVRGYYHVLLKDYAKAEQDFLMESKLFLSDTLLNYRNLVNVYLFTGKYSKALRYSDMILKLNPNDGLAYADIGRIYSEKKDYDKAFLNFNKALEINTSLFNAYGGRAKILLKRGNYKEALIDAQSSTLINPNYAFGYYISGQAKALLKKEGACDDLYRAKSLGQGDVDDLILFHCK